MIENLNIQVIRAKRKKTATIEILPGEIVRVTAPKELTENQMSALLKTRSSWITEKLRLIRDIPIPRKREFVNGESFPLFGKDYRLKISEDYLGEVLLKNGRIYVPAPKGLNTYKTALLIRQRLVGWYKCQAEVKIKERAKIFAKKLVVEPNSISIKEYKARWGTCTPKGDLIFNWRLVMAPISVLDYVVVHELCHLDEPNHGKDFWKLVASVKPNYKNDQKWLKFSGLEQII